MLKKYINQKLNLISEINKNGYDNVEKNTILTKLENINNFIKDLEDIKLFLKNKNNDLNSNESKKLIEEILKYLDK